MTAGGLAAGGVAEGVRRAARGEPPSLRSAMLNADNARRLAQRLSHLRGAAMKLGQLLSMEADDLLPPEFTAALEILRSDADAMPAAQLHRVLGQQYGKGWRARFERFDETPIAAASIGQVHRARAQDGRELVLKIQYPGVARSVSSDVDNVALLLRMFSLLPAQIDIDGLASEAKRQLKAEADYEQEGKSMARYWAHVADDPDLRMPQYDPDLSTRHILAMTYMEGRPLDQAVEAGLSQPTRDHLGGVIERLLFRELFDFRLMQTDPNPANYLYDGERNALVLLDFGATQAFDANMVRGYRDIAQAIVDDDPTAIERAALNLGYIAARDAADQKRTVVALIRLICEPLRHPGPYDFGESDLPSRAWTEGMDLAFEQGLIRSPPPETMFLHRKLVGSFLLCARLGARVDVRASILPFLSP
jgi:predicted unusual protein kinase regulating ubiquinone biosynthesis (AarF/ABC1/UbiB family)